MIIDEKRIDEPTPDGAHGWIQWKGTDVCIDLHCQCGAHMHHDGDFMYNVKCGKCGQRYQTAQYVKLYPLPEDWPDPSCMVEIDE